MPWWDLVDIPANATVTLPDTELDGMMDLSFYYLLIMHVLMILAMYLIDFFRKRRPKMPIPPDEEAEVILEARLLADYDRLERQYRILSALLRCADAA